MLDRRQRFWLYGAAIELVPAHCATEDERARALSTGDARWQLQQAQCSERSFGDRALQGYAQHLQHGDAPPSVWETGASLDDALLRAVEEGGLLVVPDPPVVAPTRRSRVAAETPRDAQELTWVEIEMLDEAGQPRAGVRYVLTTPNGQRREGTLDQRGRARIEHIVPGSCEVRFPDLAGPVTRG